MFKLQEELKQIDSKIERLKQRRILMENLAKVYGEDIFGFRKEIVYKHKNYINNIPIKEVKELSGKILEDINFTAVKTENNIFYELEKIKIISYLNFNNKKILIDESIAGHIIRAPDYHTYKIRIQKYPENIINENVIFQAFMEDVLRINSSISNMIVVSGHKEEIFKDKMNLLIFK